MKKLSLVLLLAALTACSGSTGEPGTTADNNGGGTDAGVDQADATDAAVETEADAGVEADATSPEPDTGTGSAEPVGGDRPAEVVVPRDWTEEKDYPVVVLLHGYTATSRIQNVYFRTSTFVDELQFILVLPEGLEDGSGEQFWNATDWCCDFGGINPDDSTYLSELATEVVQRYSGDEKRVYFMGHSNGGFMSHRMACDHADQVAAIASLAGTSYWDPADCEPTEPVGVLQMHGTFDATIRYNGAVNMYPSAEDTIDRWVERNGCDPAFSDGGEFDYDTAVSGPETEVQSWPICDGDVNVELWKMVGSGHIPGLDGDITRAALEFLFEHSKP